MPNTEENIKILQKSIGYTFNNEALLVEALSHSSYVNERKINKTACYERLEFLGDAVLELVSSTLLFKNNPNLKEGELSKMRASLVCEKALAPCARKIQLGSYILLGRGEKMNHGQEHDSILSDVLEAVIGAIYLDGGFERAGEFISEFILDEESLKNGFMDYKTILQEIAQADSKCGVVYELLNASGPEHNRIYEVCVKLDDKVLGYGKGSNKKNAEQMAAKEAIEYLKKGR